MANGNAFKLETVLLSVAGESRKLHLIISRKPPQWEGMKFQERTRILAPMLRRSRWRTSQQTVEESSENTKQLQKEEEGGAGAEWRQEGKLRVPMRYDGWVRGVRTLGVVRPPAEVDGGRLDLGEGM